MSIEFTRKQYLSVYIGDRYISRHTNLVEAAEAASRDAEALNEDGNYEIRIGTEVYYAVSIRNILRNTQGLIITEASPPPLNSPPEWDSQPSISFVFGIASSYDMDDITSDPDGDPITHSLNTGSVPLPTGLSWDAGTGVLSYDGLGAIVASSGHIFTIDDGTDSTDSSATDFNIGTGRDSRAGVYLIWEPIKNTVNDLSFVKGGMPRSELDAMVDNGDYSNSGTYNPWQIRNSWNDLAGAVGGPKGGQMQITSKKPTTWQKHVWYANGATALGAPKVESPDWIGAYWTADGQDVMRGCFDLSTWFWNSPDMTQSMKDLCVGIRVNYNAITSEGTVPGNTLDNINHAAWTKGSLASATRPPSYTSSLKTSSFSSFLNYVMDQSFPSSDSDPELYPLLHRPRHANYGSSDADASTEARVKALWTAHQAGIFTTNGNPEPSSTFQMSQYQCFIDFCKFAGGNPRAFNEGFGSTPDDSSHDAQWSVLQMVYWTMLLNMHVGISYLGIRDEYVVNVGEAGDLGAEWQAAMDFGEKYAGFQQFPSASPGAWLALREGHRLTGNYTFLMTQVITGAGDRGVELYAGSDGTSFPYPDNDYVGIPSDKNHQTGTIGFGNRQSIWAFNFDAGQNLKTVIDSTCAATLDGISTTVRVHYLDDSDAATFEVSAFGNSLGSVFVNNTLEWKIAEFVIPTTTVSTDVDGAHIVITPSGAGVRFHLVEIEKT